MSITTPDSDIIYVNSDAESGNNDGSSWGNAFTSLVTALEHNGTEDGDRIWIAMNDGGYKPGFDQPATFDIDEVNLQLYGGFVGNESSLEERDENNRTILNGEIQEIGPGDNITTILTISSPSHSTTVVDGIVISDGGSIGSGSFNGGAINSSSALIINNCDFLRNQTNAGAAIYLSTSNVTDIHINESSFSSNVAQDNGGAIYFSSNGSLTIENTDIRDNTANQHGGGLYHRGNQLDLDLCFFSGNFISNTATEGGGAIFFSSGKNIEITNSEFRENEGGTEVGAGAIYVGGFVSNLTIINGLFTSNTAENIGGAIVYESQGTFSIEEGEFNENTSTSNGGAIYTSSAGLTSINSTSFSQNEADNSGGAIYGSGGEVQSNMALVGSNFNGNKALNNHGGALYISFVDLDIENTDFEGNEASYGGGIFITSGRSSQASLEVMTGNLSGLAGGGANLATDVVNLTNSTFSENEAQKRGGGLAVRGSEIGTDTQLQIVNSTFSMNTSETSGGGIHWGATDMINAAATLYHVTIFGNTANGTGGGVSVFEGSDNFYFNNTIVAGNTGVLGQSDIANIQGEQSGDIIVETGGFISEGYNLIGDVGVLDFATNTEGDQYGDPQDTTTPNEGATESATLIDPLLDVLADNFGDIPTNALLSGSPAINTGSISEIDGDPLLTDQRGFEHLGLPDIGAFEYYLTFPPVLNNSLELTLSNINEDEVGNDGSLLKNIGGDNEFITDIDGPDNGVAITAVNTTAGNWQYSLDNGTTWTNAGSPTVNSALLLPLDDQARIRLQPALNTSGTYTDAVTFKAWDQAAGTAGGTLDVSSFANDSPFSEASETIAITVNSVNDAPTVVNPISDLEIPLGRFSFTFADDILNDIEDGNALSYSVEGLPTWLDFDAIGRNFSGNLVSGTSGTATITLIATDSDGATGSDVFDIVINPLLAVNDELGRSISIYPVPSNGNLSFHITNEYFSEVKFRVIDQVGRNIFQRQFPKNQQELSADFDLSSLQKGMYLMEISTSNGRFIKRFVLN